MSLNKIDNVETPLMASLYEYKNPLVVFCFGTLIGATFYFKEIKLIYLLVLCLLISILFLFKRNKKIFIMLVSVVIGYFYSVLYFRYFVVNLDALVGKKAIFIGEILSSPDEDSPFNKKYLFGIKNIIDEGDSKKDISSKVQVIGSHYEEYDVGDIVQITGKLAKPKSAILPGLFDEKRYLLSKGVNYLLKEEPGTLLFLDSPASTYYTKKISELRTRLISVNEKYLSSNQLAIVNGIVFGSKASKMPDYLKEKIQNLGLSHITSASGFNVSVLALSIFYLFRLFTRNSLLPTVISILAVLLYLALADFSGSIIRATTFIVLILIGSLFNKKLKILPAISLIVLVFFYFNPVNILDVGLQLSIMAFLGLALFLNEYENNSFLFSVFLQSLFAQIMVVPLIVFYFHNIQLLGLLSNIIAVPLAALILIVGLLDSVIVFLPVFDTVNGYLCLMQKVLSGFFLSWINLLDKINYKQIFLPNLNFYFLILIYALILYCLFSYFIKAFRERYKAVLIVFIVFFTLTYFVADTSRYLKIFCLARYNNDSVLVVLPDEKAILISSMLDYKSHKSVVDFLRLNNISSDYNLYYVNEQNSYFSSFVKDNLNKISVTYNKFSFDILKNYNTKALSNATFLKLPILMKKDPDFQIAFDTLPQNVIVNDIKRLSKKSVRNITWLKSQPIKSYFLSESGTITLITNGINYKIDFLGVKD